VSFQSCLHNFVDPTIHQQLVLSSFLDVRAVHKKTTFPYSRNTMNSAVRRSDVFLKTEAPSFFTQCAQQLLGSYPRFIDVFVNFHGPMVRELMEMIPFEVIVNRFYDRLGTPELNELFNFGDKDMQEFFSRTSLRDAIAILSSRTLTLKQLKERSLTDDNSLMALVLFLSENTGFLHSKNIGMVSLVNTMTDFNPFRGVDFELTPKNLFDISGPVGYFLYYASEVHRVHEEIKKVTDTLKPDWPFR
jgi:hypothetical protein